MILVVIYLCDIFDSDHSCGTDRLNFLNELLVVKILFLKNLFQSLENRITKITLQFLCLLLKATGGVQGTKKSEVILKDMLR